MSLLFLLGLVACLLIFLLLGYPVAFVLGGSSLLWALIGASCGAFDLSLIMAHPMRVYGIMSNDLLLAIPLFVTMGVTLERAKIAEELLEIMSRLFGNLRAGLGIAVLFVGTLLAASTGIVGATVVTMGLISLPAMLKRGYAPSISCGAICAAGTLGQIIPPSIVLILLGDQISNAYQSSQLSLGNMSPEPVSMGDLFLACVFPGLILVILYMIWFVVYSFIKPEDIPAEKMQDKRKMNFVILCRVVFPPILLIFIVLGSILAGIATATESAAMGAIGAFFITLFRRQLSWKALHDIGQSTLKVSCMVFSILIGAAMFSLVFRGYGGDDLIQESLTSLPGGFRTAMLVVMIMMFLMGYILDFIEIIYVVVPVVAPILLKMGADPVWLAAMIAINLQTSFLTPPFGFSLFYLRGVAPKEVETTDIYKGVMPFVVIQLFALGILAGFPSFATWLPKKIYGHDFTTEKKLEENTLPILHSIDF